MDNQHLVCAILKARVTTLHMFNHYVKQVQHIRTIQIKSVTLSCLIARPQCPSAVSFGPEI